MDILVLPNCFDECVNITDSAILQAVTLYTYGKQLTMVKSLAVWVPKKTHSK